MKYVMARYKVKKEKVEEEFVDGIRKNEPDTLFYDVFQEGDGASFVRFMSFKDDKAHEFHRSRSTPHVKKFVEILYPYCEEEPTFTELRW